MGTAAASLAAVRAWRGAPALRTWLLLIAPCSPRSFPKHFMQLSILTLLQRLDAVHGEDKQWMSRPKSLLCAADAVGSSRNYVLCCSCLNIAKHPFYTQKCVMGDNILRKCINHSGSDFPKPHKNTWSPWKSGSCSHPKDCSAGWCWPLPRTPGSHTPSPQLHFSCCSLGRSGTTGLWWG